MNPTKELGAVYLDDNRTSFSVWAPFAQKAEVRIVEPEERLIPMRRDEWGYHNSVAEGVKPDYTYVYRLDGDKDRPDPASHYQPEGVHGPSQVVNHTFDWDDSDWFGTPLQDYIIYELHVGTFTSEGTFVSIIPYLDYLKDLGVTAIELMPVAQFPGARNWGYDGVCPYAVQDSYGGVQGLKQLVNACHQKGLAVVLDVVYNHLGPEGNYLADFGPYFTERYNTPWGAALNFDGPHSDHVRRFFIENALYWQRAFHIDAFRLDAVHAILDHSPVSFVEELGRAVEEQAAQLNRRAYLIAESSANDARLITSRELGGYGMDAQWSDDFHHCLHTLLTGELDDYYQDYGKMEHLAKALRDGYAYTGQYSPYRQYRHGSPSHHIPAERFVVCSQNHDQIGNRMLGERISHLVSFEQQKLAAGLTLLSPYIPLLFMGEEYGETAPFQYFISHTDPELVEAVRKGRQEEFAGFLTQGEPPDPQDEATFIWCKLDHSLRDTGHHKVLLDFYKELICLRRNVPALNHLDKDTLEVELDEKQKSLLIHRWYEDSHVVIVCNFGDVKSGAFNFPEGRWKKLLDSAESQWDGAGSSALEIVESKGDEVVDLSPHSLLLLVND